LQPRSGRGRLEVANPLPRRYGLQSITAVLVSSFLLIESMELGYSDKLYFLQADFLRKNAELQ